MQQENIIITYSIV